eukprot:COSAG02_NODE_5201_length_4546_cov_2.786373_1_plen_37_part_00
MTHAREGVSKVIVLQCNTADVNILLAVTVVTVQQHP